MNNYEYTAATSIDEAVSLLAARGERAVILAGGTDILVQLREDQREADLVVDVKKIPELGELRFNPADGLHIGAAVACYRIYDDPQIAAAYPGIVDATRIIGGWQIQSRASLGGNLCNSSPAADSIPPMIVHDGTCQIAGPEGSREVPVADFCTGPGKNVLARGEFLVSLSFPPPADRSSGSYLRFIPRNEMDIAVVGAGAWVQLDGSGKKIDTARIALAAVAPTPVVAQEAGDWLAGKDPSEKNLAEAGERAKAVARPISDMRSSAEYRTHLVGVLTRRALWTAVERAAANGHST